MRSVERVQISRAQRFPLHIPIQYRRSDPSAWHESKTVNISRTGILFTTDQVLAPHTALEIQVRFPTAAVLSCQGSVVRTPESACAVKIHNCRLLPKNPRRGSE
jgi:hypothetical protein